MTLPATAVRLRGQSYLAQPDPSGSPILDLLVPEGDGPFPVAVWIHGGGWHSGSRQPEGDLLAGRFLPRGIALAAIDYRLTPTAPFPAQLDDCKAALAWLRANAARFSIDTERIGLLGHSAGAHLCMLLAVTDHDQWIKAAVCWSPPCDLDRVRGEWPPTTFAWNPNDPFCRTFFPGGRYDDGFAREASPTTHLHGAMPPMLVVHGERDTVVPFAQAARFAELGRAAGSDVTFRVAPDRGHDTMGDETEAEALAFFEETLGRR